ncbi:MAG: DUF3552 domain-containing protein, partial [Desulfovibrionales bacterium]|nr:DUF3552 domain-containing protein [Desulfovibrionales bacterium]
MASQIFFTALLCFGVGSAIGFYLKKYLTEQELNEAQSLSARILDEARKDAQAHKKEVLVQAQDEIFALKKEVEQDR